MNSTMPPVYLNSARCFAGLGVGLALVGERDDQALFRMPVRAGAAKAISKLYSVAVKIVLSE